MTDKHTCDEHTCGPSCVERLAAAIEAESRLRPIDILDRSISAAARAGVSVPPADQKHARQLLLRAERRDRLDRYARYIAAGLVGAIIAVLAGCATAPPADARPAPSPSTQQRPAYALEGAAVEVAGFQLPARGQTRDAGGYWIGGARSGR